MKLNSRKNNIILSKKNIKTSTNHKLLKSNIFLLYPLAFPPSTGMTKGLLLGSRGAFTLVELIVVVTILALLSTIGFVSYSSYLSGVRDTNRVSQLVAISDGLELYRTKKTLPIPDDNIEIRANGTVIGYQGYAGVNVLETIDYSKTGKDPKDKTYFSYYLTQDKKHYQLLTYLEEEENLETNNNLFQKTYADTDYTNRYPKVSGKKLGILTQSGTNIPVQEVTEIVASGYLDIVTTTDNYIARLTDDNTISGTGTNLVATLPAASCKRLKQMGKSVGNGIYKINPTGTKEFKVYCDMTIDGGGWTLVMNSSTQGNCTNFGVFRDCGELDDSSNPYSINISELGKSTEVLSYRVKDGGLKEDGFISKQNLGHNSFALGLHLIDTNIRYLTNDSCPNRIVGEDIAQTWQIGVSAIYQELVTGTDTGGGYKGWNWGWFSCQAAGICNGGLFKNGFSNYAGNDGCTFPAFLGGAVLIPDGSQAAIFIR